MATHEGDLHPATPAGISALVGAFGAMAEDIDLNTVLERVASAACALVDARYGALGVIGPDRLLSAFITVGLENDAAGKTFPQPRGHDAPGLSLAHAHSSPPHDLPQHERAGGTPEQHPRTRSFVDVPIRIHDRVFGNLYLTEKNGGGGFTGTDEKLLVALAAAAAIAIANSHLFDDSARRTRWLEGGLDAVREILEQTDPSRSPAESTAHHALRASHSDLTLVLRETGDRRGLLCEAAAGPDAGSFASDSWDYPALLDDLTATSTPLLLTPAEIDGLLPGFSPPAPSTALCVRLAGSGERRYILFGRRSAFPFTDVDHEMVRTFTSNVSLALELLRAHRRREQEAVFGDRDRIARDLHDLVVQRLFAAGLSIQNLRKHLSDRKALERIGAVTAQLDATIRELRDTIYSLRSVPQVTPNFSAGIFALVEATAREHALQPDLNLSGPLDAAMDPGSAEHVRGVLQEGLSNALRHAAAHSVTITVQALEDHLEMQIIDDGIGFAEPSSGPGLTGMRRHAELCGGTLSISSTPGRGTRVLLTVPLTARGS
ncbi:signal transduction histidine kinase [Arthrobacter sp. CAN_A2]|uniref:GAF domain-containing sensor histidine kinase n=1 Tax=Arthrobacter sp. CAN_A2 TaxID=2787718 RepID=UPI0018F0413C